MREIKFRAWDKITKSMFDVGEICWFGDGTRIDATLDRIDIQDREGFHQLGTDIELMQYTGLKDKNGIEMYEGDIISYQGEYTPERGYVTWFKSGCWGIHRAELQLSELIYQQALRYEASSGKPVYTEIEVIGNIYESPELLEVNNEPQV